MNGADLSRRLLAALAAATDPEQRRALAEALAALLRAAQAPSDAPRHSIGWTNKQ